MHSVLEWDVHPPRSPVALQSQPMDSGEQTKCELEWPPQTLNLFFLFSELGDATAGGGGGAAAAVPGGAPRGSGDADGQRGGGGGGAGCPGRGGVAGRPAGAAAPAQVRLLSQM